MKDKVSYKVIAIGASEGGFMAVAESLGRFKGRSDSVFLVVLHGYPDVPSVLAERLSQLIEMPVSYAENEMKIETGKVFLAPPDHHLMVKEDKLLLTSGPKENLYRPSIDVLFRSVAVEYGNRVIGVLLTGRLSDGTLGLSAIRRCGGVTIVQDPATAGYADMPKNAKLSVHPDFSLHLEDMPGLFNRLLDAPLPPEKDVPAVLRKEVGISGHPGSLIDGKNLKENEGDQPFSCPSCGGPLTRMEDEEVAHFRCRIGHSFTLQSLSEGQDRQLEETLWVALRVLDERTALLKKMIYDSERKGMDMLAKSHQHKLEEIQHHAFHLKRLMGLND